MLPDPTATSSRGPVSAAAGSRARCAADCTAVAGAGAAATGGFGARRSAAGPAGPGGASRESVVASGPAATASGGAAGSDSVSSVAAGGSSPAMTLVVAMDVASPCFCGRISKGALQFGQSTILPKNQSGNWKAFWHDRQVALTGIGFPSEVLDRDTATALSQRQSFLRISHPGSRPYGSAAQRKPRSFSRCVRGARRLRA